MTSSDQHITHEDILTVFDRFDDPQTPVTAAEVASTLDCSHTIAVEVLTTLVEHGTLRTKHVGGSERIWWHPPHDPSEMHPETAQLTALMQAVTEYAIFILDHDGHVTSWNEGAERIKGYTDSEIVGEHFSVFYTEADIDADVPESNLAKAAADGEYTDKGWRVRRDGTRFWANVTITALYDSDGSVYGYTKVTRDNTKQHEYEQQLQRERDLVDRILDTIPVGVTIFNPDKTLARANSRAGQTVGHQDENTHEYEIDTLDAYDTDDTIVPVDGRPYDRVFETKDSISDEVIQYELPTGERRWISVNAAPLLTQDGELERVIVTEKDITQLKNQTHQLERQRDELERELQDMFARIDDAFFALDREWRFTYVNERAEEIIEKSEAELLGNVVWDEYLEGAETTFQREFERAMTTQQAVTFEEHYHPLDRWFSIRAYPSETGLSVYFQDISEKKERERTLEQSKTTMETVWDGIITLDADDRFAVVNDAFCTMVGYDREKLIGEHVTLIHSSRINEEVTLLNKSVLAGESPFVTLEFDMVTADGETIPVEGRFGPYEYGDGTYGRTGVVRDITDRNRRKEELETQITQQTATATLGKRALEEPDLDRLMDEAVALVTETLDTDYCKVLELLPNGDELLLRAGIGWNEGIVGSATVETDRHSQAGYTLLSTEPVVVEDLTAESRFSGPDLLIEHGVESGISVIIGSPTNPWGVLGTHDQNHRKFSVHDINFVRSVSNILATAIERANQELLLSATRSIAEAKTFEDGLQAALHEVCTATQWEYGEVWTESNDGLEFLGAETGVDHTFDPFIAAARDRRFRRGEGLVGRVWKTKSPEWIKNISEASDSKFVRRNEARTVGLKATLSVPITAQNEIIAVFVFSMTESREKNEWMVESLSSIAEEIGGVVSRRQIERALEREKELVEQILETNPLGITVLTADGAFVRLNTRAEQLFGRSREELLGRQLTQSEWRLFDENNQLIPVEDRPTTQVLETGKTIRDWEAKIERLDGQYKWVSVNAAPITNADGTITHFVFTADDITEQKHRERELKHQIEALQPLNRYNTLVRAVTEATVEESTVTGIEQVVCETFASFDLYSFAVIGEFTPDEEFVPRSWGGINETELKTILAANPGRNLQMGLGSVAVQTNTVQVTQTVSGTDAESQRSVADREYQAVAFVPLSNNDVVHGVLSVYATSSFAFSEADMRLLEELGRTIGLSIATMRTRQLLYSETITELNVEIAGSRDFLLTTSKQASCTLTLDTVVPITRESYLAYVTVDGAIPEEIVTAITGKPSVLDVRVIDSDTDHECGKLEVHLSNTASLAQIIEYGAHITKFVANSGTGRLVVASPSRDDTQSMLRWLYQMFDDVQFESLREIPWTPQETTSPLDELDVGLTERQDEVIETAHYAGYFAWPRESTAEEVAAAMEITPPTLHHHLRKGVQKIVAAFVDPTGEQSVAQL